MDGWNDHLASTEIYGRETDLALYQIVKQDDPEYKDLMQASHILFYSYTDKIAVTQYPKVAVVLMQMRFDGYLGFPGGLVDEGETAEEAINRELVEEISYEPEKFGAVSQEHYLFTQVNTAKSLLMHFYAKQLTESQIHGLITVSPSARDYGDESLGFVHVPLYTMGDSYRGFPAFLRHNFVGCARLQLTNALIKLNILTEEYVEKSLAAQPARI